MVAPRSRSAPAAKADVGGVSRSHGGSSHAPSWVEYLTWRRLLVGLILLGPLVAVVVSVLVTGSDRVLLPLLAWGLLVVLVGYRLQRFRCPRCHHRFFRQRPVLLGLIARRCVVCMLPKE